MSDTQPNDDPVVNPDPVVEDVNKPVDSIPYSRFKEVNDALKSANEALAEMKKSQEKVRTKELEEKEEWKTLADERQAKIDELNAKATEWDEFQANRRKALIEKLPEDDREVYGVLPLDKLEIHVEKITNNNVPGVSTSPPANDGEFGGYESYADWAANDPKGYKKATQKKRKFTLGYGG